MRGKIRDNSSRPKGWSVCIFVFLFIISISSISKAEDSLFFNSPVYIIDGCSYPTFVVSADSFYIFDQNFNKNKVFKFDRTKSYSIYQLNKEYIIHTKFNEAAINPGTFDILLSLLSPTTTIEIREVNNFDKVILSDKKNGYYMDFEISNCSKYLFCLRSWLNKNYVDVYDINEYCFLYTIDFDMGLLKLQKYGDSTLVAIEEKMVFFYEIYDDSYKLVDSFVSPFLLNYNMFTTRIYKEGLFDLVVFNETLDSSIFGISFELNKSAFDLIKSISEFNHDKILSTYFFDKDSLLISTNKTTFIYAYSLKKNDIEQLFQLNYSDEDEFVIFNIYDAQHYIKNHLKNSINGSSVITLDSFILKE